MINLLFNRSKPLGFILLSAILLLWILVFTDYSLEFWALLGRVLLQIVLSVSLLFFLNFIIQKNKLTQNNHFALYFFVLFWGLYASKGVEIKEMWSLLFMLMGLRKVLALRTGTEVRQKVFDASFWLSISILFEPISLVFLVPIYVSLLLFSGKPGRLWLIPLFGAFSVFFPVFAGYYLFDLSDHFYQLFYWPKILYTDGTLSNQDFQIVTFLMAVSCISLVFFYRKLVRKSAVSKKCRFIIFYSCILFCGMLMLYCGTESSVLLMALPFISIPCAAFTEVLKRPLWRNIWLYAHFILVLMIVFGK